tara:strand:- start:651 stop:1553 length:903 start_codon:yes stop_codon:yes gene_type:complete
MKRLLLLLTIPTLSYSQITYEDVMSINSEKTFKRVMIENGFEHEDTDNNQYVWYGLNTVKDSVKGSQSSFWGSYYKRNGEFTFQISLRSSFGLDFFGKQIENEDNVYNEIIEKIKKNCNYYDIIEKDGDDFVCYSCSQSTYKGKIGFTKSDGWGFIKHIIPKKPITYDDIMSVNSLDTYKKVILENGYTFLENTDSIIVYGITLKKDSTNYYDEWFLYEKDNGEFKIKFNEDKNNRENPYNIIIDKIKNNCTFYDTLKNDEWIYDYICYSCSESTYKGKICYMTTDSISYITHMIPTKEE